MIATKVSTGMKNLIFATSVKLIIAETVLEKMSVLNVQPISWSHLMKEDVNHESKILTAQLLLETNQTVSHQMTKKDIGSVMFAKMDSIMITMKENAFLVQFKTV